MNVETYAVRAQRHKPQTSDEIQRAARDLAGQGFSDHTISAILKLDVAAVRQLIGERTVA